MNTEAMQAPALVQRLVQSHGAQWVGLDDAEAFTAQCSDVAVFETPDLPTFYRAVERLRDSALFTTPYFELVQILPSIENGFRHFEQSEA